MDGQISLFPECMENVGQIMRNQAFPIQSVNAIDRRIVIGKGQLIIGENQINDGLTNHTQLH